MLSAVALSVYECLDESQLQVNQSRVENRGLRFFLSDPKVLRKQCARYR